MLAEAVWETGSLSVAGRSIDYRRSTCGDGVPIVHIHGFAISGRYLMPTARRLAGRRVNVVPDLPGYGRSERRDRVLGIPELAESLLAVMDCLGIDRAVLVANSMGCSIALEVAHSAPGRVDRLILVSPAGELQSQPLVRGLGRLARDALRERVGMLRLALPDYGRFGPLNALRLFRQLAGYPSQERLMSTPVPTLAVLGGRDPLTAPPARVRDLVRRCPAHLTVALIDDAAHAVNFSHPEELADLIETWLNDEVPNGGHLMDGVRVVIPCGGVVQDSHVAGDGGGCGAVSAGGMP